MRFEWCGASIAEWLGRLAGADAAAPRGTSGPRLPPTPLKTRGNDGAEAYQQIAEVLVRADDFPAARQAMVRIPSEMRHSQVLQRGWRCAAVRGEADAAEATLAEAIALGTSFSNTYDADFTRDRVARGAAGGGRRYGGRRDRRTDRWAGTAPRRVAGDRTRLWRAGGIRSAGASASRGGRGFRQDRGASASRWQYEPSANWSGRGRTCRPASSPGPFWPGNPATDEESREVERRVEAAASPALAFGAGLASRPGTSRRQPHERGRRIRRGGRGERSLGRGGRGQRGRRRRRGMMRTQPTKTDARILQVPGAGLPSRAFSDRLLPWKLYRRKTMKLAVGGSAAWSCCWPWAWRRLGPRERTLRQVRPLHAAPSVDLWDMKRPDNTPPEGFTALFNGKDLTGWQGLRDAAAAGEAERRRAGRRRRRRPNDRSICRTGRSRTASSSTTARATACRRQGLRQLRAVRRLEDRAEGRQRHLPARQPAGADLGLGQPRRQPAARTRGKRLRRAVEQPRGQHGKSRSKKADKPVGEWNTFHIIMNGDKVTV